MILSPSLSNSIVTIAHNYLGKPFDWHTFHCVHFVIEVYREAGIEMPAFTDAGYPPTDFHLSPEEFNLMPVGHSVFFKRRANTSNLIWTHMAIIASPNELIHCSRFFGCKVTVTSKIDFLEIYALASQPPHS
ncbi:MAG: hypothetical protein PHG25_01840 [Candidatus Pacebacteria bacterium]|nr:hypothetical protein [Candidatus Paceibacterota bacterium]